MVKFAFFSFLVLALFTSPSRESKRDQLRASVDLFQKTREAIDLRSPGSTPFHLHATFHAFPGMELVPPGKEQITSGDGVYDELWIAPHVWRREVTLAGYHAVEVESAAGRKMQSSDDYEPARILMLLDGLMDPVTKDLASVEYRHEDAGGWVINTVSLAGKPLLRVSKTGDSVRAVWSDAFFLLPTGGFVLRNERGLVTSWEDQAPFFGKQVPRRLRVMAEPDRELVNAQISVERAVNPAADSFALPGPQAEPGDTLRPLHSFEVHMPDLSYSSTGGISPLNMTPPGYSFHSVLDRHGRYREVEVLNSLSLSGAQEHFEHRRGLKFPPANIDGAPCEIGMVTIDVPGQ